MKLALRWAALLVFTAWTAAAQDPSPVTGSHSALPCSDCHLTSGLSDCTQCHDDKRNIHPVGFKPATEVPKEFALDSEGRLLCRTCHRLHGGDAANYYLNVSSPHGGDRADFCGRCHGDRLARTNPHQATRGTRRCAFCHTSIPEEGQQHRPQVRTDILRLCDFCHGAVAKNHPRNIDPALSLPKDLPLGPDGSWNCSTCHEPHGTTTTTHYIRPQFAKHFERGRQENPHQDSWFACKACHATSMANEIRAPDYQLRYRGDVTMLCISCHVTDRGHHPTGVQPPPYMLDAIKASRRTIPLDEEGRITCYSCHDNSCSTGRQKMRERYYDRVSFVNDLCWTCHEQAEFSRIKPHNEDPENCTQCHESRPLPGVSLGLIAVPKMICLRCHDVKPHPAGADHLKVPPEKMSPDPSLPLGAGGKITCVTCHDPHGRGEPLPRRLRSAASRICQLCHWR